MDAKKHLTSLDNNYNTINISTSNESYETEGGSNIDEYSESNELNSENDDIQILLTDPSASFVAEFTDGYAFRNMIEYLRATNSKGNFRFSNDIIYYEQADPNLITVNQIEINTCDLSNYEFYSNVPELIVGVNISDMRAITKTIGKKDSIRLYKNSNDPILYIQIISGNTRSGSRTNISIVRPQQVEVINYNFPEYKRNERFPNCTVSSTDFAKMCTSMSSLKCNTVTVHGYPKGVVFEGLTEGSMSGRIEQFGSPDGFTSSQSMDSSIPNRKLNNITIPNGPKPRLIIKNNNPEEQVNIKIKMSLIKSLAKLNNLSNHGMIKLYMEQDNPLKIMCQIGNYGTLRVYIRSDDEC